MSKSGDVLIRTEKGGNHVGRVPIYKIAVERTSYARMEVTKEKANCSECTRNYDNTCSGALAEKCYGKW